MAVQGEGLRRPEGLPPGHIRSLGAAGGALVAGLLHKVAEETLHLRWASAEASGQALPAQPGRPGHIVALAGYGGVTATQRQATSAGTLRRWSSSWEVEAEVVGRALGWAAGAVWLATRDGSLERWSLASWRAEARVEDAALAAALAAPFRPPTLAHPAQQVAAGAPEVDRVRLVALDGSGRAATHGLGWEVAGLAPGLGEAPVVACGYEGEVAGLGWGGVVWERRVEGIGCALERAAWHPGLGTLLPDDEGGLVALGVGGALRRWEAEPDPHGAAIDVLAVEPGLSGRVAFSGLNHRLRVVSPGGGEVRWEGSDPITACAFVPGWGLVVGDQAGAVTLLG